MKKTALMITMSAFFGLVYLLAGNITLEAAKPAKSKEAAAPRQSCVTCHPDFAPVLPKGHPPAAGKDIGACTTCHKPDVSGKAAANAFSARLHRAHEGKTDCVLCHTWVPGKSFGLLGQKLTWGKPSKEEMALLKQVSGTWATSTYMDAGHGKKNVTCMGCHGKALPAEGDSVENDRCLECHGPLEKLQAKTAPKDLPDRNPHKSHLGDIGCTVCHKGHKESAVYCLQCHPNFQMKLK
ncbi:MAG: cytochrome c3 family protein [Deltaproteobacteria bacterium]|nr:cytochrome c3 family protein [Deltaproteobacteria bacterium]